MKVVAIIQARMGSTRLPGKVCCELAGAPMLARVFERTAAARTLDEVVVATSFATQDDPIASLARHHGWPLFRGSEHDVLDRYYHAARVFRAQVVVRITADCPLMDGEVIDRTVTAYMRRCGTLAYCSSALAPRTFPRGLDVEVFGADILEQTWRECLRAEWREHVTPFIYAQPQRFPLCGVYHDRDVSHLRWTVDTPEDLACVRHLYEAFGNATFSWREALWLVENRPQLAAVNAHVVQRAVPGLREAA